MIVVGRDSDSSVIFYAGIRFVNNGISAHRLSLSTLSSE